MSQMVTGQKQEIPPALIEWLLDTDAPWIHYQTRTQLLDLTDRDAKVVEDRQQLLAHPKIQALIESVASWPGDGLKRHNDAKHLLHHLPVLAELGVRADDPGMERVAEAVLNRQSQEGAFQSLIIIPRVFGGTNEETLAWMLCDAPTVLYALLKLGLQDHPAVHKAVDHLVNLVEDTGWPCVSSQVLGKIKGPGLKNDSCPYANLIVLKALACVPALHDHPAVHNGVNMLLEHWEHQKERKIRMFGIGTDFRKLKYPFVWYDILHVADTLSQFAWIRRDQRLLDMVAIIAQKQDTQGRYKAESVWMTWKDWDFGQKREPSRWLTFLVLRLLKRMEDNQ